MIQFEQLNPGSQYHCEEDKNNRFVSCGILLPSDDLLENSFLNTLFIDAGHCRTSNGTKSVHFILSMGDRKHWNRPIAYEWFKSESCEN